jgi:hypothetical protein
VLSNNSVIYKTTTTAAVANSNINPQGWFINLPAVKERLVVDPDAVQDKYFFFNTWIPGQTTTVVNGCSTGGSAGGSGYLMNVNLFTGTATASPIVDINADGVVDNKDKVGDAATNPTITSVVGGVIFNQGLPASSTFLNQRQYTAGASYNAAADTAAAAAAAAAKATADASAAAAAAAKSAADAAQAALDAAIASNASAAEIAALTATRDSTAAAAAAAATQAAADQAAYLKAAALAAQTSAAGYRQLDIASPVSRTVGGWRQELRD